MKVCKQCGQEKPVREFSCRRVTCKSCFSTNVRLRRANDANFHEAQLEAERRYRRTANGRRVAKARGHARYRRNHAFLDGYKSFTGCKDCGEVNPAILEFDHVRGRKSFDIGSRAQVSILRLFSEIEKCEVRCKTCHKRRHWLKGTLERPRRLAA